MVQGPTLPYIDGLYQHCLAWKDDTIIILVGGMQLNASRGISDIPKLVYEFNTESGTFAALPEVPNAVRGGGCKVIQNANGEKELVVLPGKILTKNHPFLVSNSSKTLFTHLQIICKT